MVGTSVADAGIEVADAGMDVADGGTEVSAGVTVLAGIGDASCVTIAGTSGGVGETVRFSV